MTGWLATPEGAPPRGTIVVHHLVGAVGQVKEYHPPDTFRRPDAPEDEPPIGEWCVELAPAAGQASGDVLLWRPENFSVVTPPELVLLGGAAAGVEALFKGMFVRAKAERIPFGRAVELVAIAMRSQLAGIERQLASEAAQGPGGGAYDAGAHYAQPGDLPPGEKKPTPP